MLFRSNIAYQSGCSVRTAQKEIDTLVRNGWLEKMGRIQVGDGKFGNTKYHILERDLIRGTGRSNFIIEPIANTAIGEQV